MMILTTSTQPSSGLVTRVQWKTGMRNSGTVEVMLADATEDAEVMAELVAIKYLLFDMKVFDRVPMSAKGYKLVVSRGAIKKLAQGRSDKQHLKRHAYILSTTLKGIAIEVAHRADWVTEQTHENVERIDESAIRIRNHDIVDTPVMGKVLITQHAVDQYQTRSPSEAPSVPRATLIKRITHPDLVNFALDERVLAHKARRYGRSDNVEVWGHETSTTRFLTVRDEEEGIRTLVTVYRRG